MTAETDIAAIADAGENTALDVRTALTSVLERADAGVISAPDDIAGLVLWLEADAITGLSDTDPVPTWEDQSVSGNDFTQGTAAKQPTYRTNILNGLPVVRFDGGDLMLATTLVSFTYATVAIVANRTAGTGFRGLYVTDKIGVYSSLNVTNNPWGVFLGAGGSPSKTAGVPLESRHRVLAARFLGDTPPTVELRTQGIPGPIATGTHDTRTDTAIGADPSDAQHHTGDIAALVVYNRAVAPGELVALEDHFVQKYALDQ